MTLIFIVIIVGINITNNSATILAVSHTIMHFKATSRKHSKRNIIKGNIGTAPS